MITRAEIESIIQDVDRLQDKISLLCKVMIEVVDEKLDKIKLRLSEGSIGKEDFDLMEKLMLIRELLWERIGP